MGKRNAQRRKNKRQYEEGHKHIEMERYLGQTVKEAVELIRAIWKHKTLQGNSSTRRLSGWILIPILISVYMRELLLCV